MSASLYSVFTPLYSELTSLYSVLKSVYWVVILLYWVVYSFGVHFIIFGVHFSIFGAYFVMIVTRLPKNIPYFALLKGEKMDDILTELNLETLAAVFRRERIVPSIVQSMSDEEIEGLGVTAIGDRVRLRELC